MLSRHLRRVAASSALRAESNSLLSQRLSHESSSVSQSSPFAAVRAIFSSASAAPSRALLASTLASPPRSASGRAASCSYSCSIAQGKLFGASQRGFAADAAVAAIDDESESDGDDDREEKGKGSPFKTLPDVPPGSR